MSYIDYDHKDIKAFEERKEEFKKYVQRVHFLINKADDTEIWYYVYDDVAMLTEQYLEEFAEEEM